MRNLLFTNCTKKDSELFFLTTFMGRGFLAKMNVDSGKTEYCDIMEGFVLEKTSAVMDIFQGKIYALDSYGNNLVVFDLIRNQCKYIPLKCNYQKGNNFAAFEKYGKSYYIFPRYGNKIIILDIDKNRITEMQRSFGDGKKIQCICRAGNDMWILPENADQIYCYSISENKEKVYKLGRIIQNCVHSVFNESSLYILNMYGVIYRWDIERTELYEITALETKHDENESMSRILYAGNRLITLPGYGNYIRLFDILTEKTSVYCDYPKDFKYQSTWLKYYGYCEDEKFYYFAAASANYLLKIEKMSGGLTWIKVDKDSLREKTLELLAQAGVNMFSEGGLDIMDLLQLEVSGNCQADNDSIGKKIYDALA